MLRVRHLAILTILLSPLLAACATSASAQDQPATATSPATDTPAPTPSPTVTATSTPLPSPMPTPSATPLPERVVDAHGVTMVLIPDGEFIMGSEEGFPDEAPTHKVYLDSFYIDLTEVTNSQYRACVEAGVCQPPRRTDCCTEDPNQYIAWPSYFDNLEFDDYPVIFISWYDAHDFCEWRGARLPTEAEWEKAARGTDGQPYPWGDEDPSPELLNFYWLPGAFDAQPRNTTAPVGSYPLGASPYGVLDMLGNVYQWVYDIYDPDYYSYSPYANPTGPEEGTFRVTRGGSFYNQAFRNRASNRNHAFIPASSVHFDGGARCAKDAPTD